MLPRATLARRPDGVMPSSPANLRVPTHSHGPASRTNGAIIGVPSSGAPGRQTNESEFPQRSRGLADLATVMAADGLDEPAEDVDDRLVADELGGRGLRPGGGMGHLPHGQASGEGVAVGSSVSQLTSHEPRDS